MNISRFFLFFQSIILVFFCGVATYTDIKTGKVSNKLQLITVVIVGTIILIKTIILKEWPWDGTNQGIYYFTNLALCFVISIGLYVSDIWAPGDSKMFITIVLLYPTALQNSRPGMVFPSLHIIIWAFSIGYFYLIIKDIRVSLDKVHNREGSPNSIYSTMISIALNYCVSLSISFFLNSFFPDFFIANRELCLLFIIVLISITSKQSILTRIIIAVICLISLFIFRHPYTALTFSATKLGIPFVISIVVSLLTRSAQNNNYVEIVPEDLKTGMILSRYTLCRFSNNTILSDFNSKNETRRSRLSDQEVKIVSEWALNKNENIVIVKMLPFAPFIAAGTIFEMLLSLV